MADSVVDSKANCLTCNCDVGINSKEWAETEAPYAICEECKKATPAPIIRVIYLMRCQIASTSQRMDTLELENRSLKKEMENLSKALLTEE